MKGYVLKNYELCKCILLKKGKINYKVQYNNGITDYIKPERFAFEDENICVVYMEYKGPLGAYRIEKELYSNRQRLAKNWPHQALVTELSPGIECNQVDWRLDDSKFKAKQKETLEVLEHIIKNI
jgi:hypothetical protein